MSQAAKELLEQLKEEMADALMEGFDVPSGIDKYLALQEEYNKLKVQYESTSQKQEA